MQEGKLCNAVLLGHVRGLCPDHLGQSETTAVLMVQSFRHCQQRKVVMLTITYTGLCQQEVKGKTMESKEGVKGKNEERQKETQKGVGKGSEKMTVGKQNDRTLVRRKLDG